MKMIVVAVMMVSVLTLGLQAAETTGKPAVTLSAASVAFVAKLMAFDKNHDSKLEKDEIADERYQRVFERADANHDGVVTVEELNALAVAEADQGGGRDGGPDGGPGGMGGGPGGPGGMGGGPRRGGGGMGGPQQNGQIMPAFVRDTLKLSDEQKKQLDELQKEVDGKMEKLLTEEQKVALKSMRSRGPGGMRGGPGGPGGERNDGDRR